jgi:co-chaperonin GroES (HSP10)
LWGGKLSLYTRVAINFDTIELRNSWVAVEEELAEQVGRSGLVVPSKSATTIGKVVAVGCSLKEDVQVGDSVIYKEWQGGRYDFDSVHCLIMKEEDILVVLR